MIQMKLHIAACGACILLLIAQSGETAEAIYGWLSGDDDTQVTGAIWPTIMIHYGSTCCLEEMDHKTGRFIAGEREGEAFHPGFH